MSFLKRWFGGEKKGRTVSVRGADRGKDYEGAALRRFKMRPGMWVVAEDGGVGILTGLKGGTATVMLVHDDQMGTNKMAIVVRAATLRQATCEEIPEGRRPARDEAEAMGYRARKR